ncbi:MAG: hypothetical protein J5930_09250 [Treponema sp.]|nr:hypothetical protein [Treponema sp.]
MKQTKRFIKAFAMLIASLVLPLFLTSNNIRRADDSRFGLLYPDTKTVSNNILSLPVAEYTEELLPICQSRITNPHSVRRFDRPQPFSVYFNGGPAPLQIPLLLLTSALLLGSVADYSQKSIIKYIHDQDGYKNISPYIVM